jgi:DNA repair protein RadC
MNKDIQEVQIHYSRPNIIEMPQITCSMQTEALLRSHIDLKRLDLKEFFWIILLTHTNHVLGISEIAVGDTAEVAVNKKEIFQLALKANASHIILCHNHPSGNTQPSLSDLSLTKDIASFSSMIGVTIADHLIISSEGYYSFADEGEL